MVPAATNSWKLHAEMRFLALLDRMAVRLGRKPALPPHLAVGIRGEETAFFYLRSLGYIVTARQWRSASAPGGDLDLVAWDEGTLCFVEVKTRSRRDGIAAQFAVDDDKQRMLRRLARAYLRSFPEPERDRIPARFDVISVYLDSEQPHCDLYKEAFSWR